MPQVIGFTVEVDGLKQSVTTAKELKDALLAIRKAAEVIPFDSPEFDKAAQEAGKLLEQQKKLTDQVKNYATATVRAAKEREAAEKAAAKAIEQAAKEAAKAQATTNKELKSNADALDKQRQAAFAAQSKRDLKAAELAAQPIGSYRALQGELTELTALYKNLSKEEREAAKGLELKDKVKGLGDELKELDAGLGNHQRNVGNYKEALIGIGDTVSGGLFSTLNGGLVGIGVAAAAAGVELFKLSGVVQARASKATALFGSSLDKVTKSAEANAHAMGLTKSEYIETAAASENLFTNLGFTNEQAADFGITLNKNAGDLARYSLGSIDATRASDLFQSALRDEYDELGNVGVAINKEAVTARLLLEGKSKLTGKAYEQAKAYATVAIIQEQLTNQTKVGDAAQGGLTQRTAEASAKFREMAETLAVKLMPLFNSLLEIGVLVGDVFGHVLEILTPVFDAISLISEGISDVISNLSEASKDSDKAAALFGRGDTSGVTNMFGVAEQRTKPEQAAPSTGERRDINSEIETPNRTKAIKQKTVEEVKAEEERVKKLADIRKQAADKAASEREARGGAGSLADLGFQLSKLKGQIEKLPSGSDKLASLSEQVIQIEKKITAETEAQETAYEAAAAAAGIETEAVKKAKEEQAALIEKQRERYEAQTEREAEARNQAVINRAAQAKETQDFEEARAKGRLEATALIQDELLSAQEKELSDVRAHYDALNAQAEDYGIDAIGLVEQQKEAEAEINEKFRKEQEEKDKEAADKKAETQQQYIDATLKGLQVLNDASALAAQIGANNVEEKYEGQLSAAERTAKETADVVKEAGDDATATQIAQAEEAATALTALEEKKAKELDEVKRKQFERDKGLAIAMAIIKGVQAGAEILATYAALPVLAGVLLAIQVAATATQVATIATTEYKAAGGFVGDNAIGQADHTGERPAYRGNIVYHVGEYVTPRKVVNDPRAQGAISLLENLRAEYGYIARQSIRPNYYAFGGVVDVSNTNIGTSQDVARADASIIAGAVYEAAKAGTLAGSRAGSAQGAFEANKDIEVMNARRATSINKH